MLKKPAHFAIACLAFVLFVLLTMVLMASGEMEQKANELERQSSHEGIDRTYKLYTEEGKLLAEYEGVSYIKDFSVPGNITVYIKSETGTWRKIDILGRSILIAESKVVE